MVPVASMVGTKMPNVAMGAGCLDRSHTTVVSALSLLRDGVQGVLPSWGQYRSTLSLNRTRYRGSHPCSEHTRVPAQRLARPAARLHPRGGYSRALSSPSAPKGHGAVANLRAWNEERSEFDPVDLQCRSGRGAASAEQLARDIIGPSRPIAARGFCRFGGLGRSNGFLDAVGRAQT